MFELFHVNSIRNIHLRFVIKLTLVILPHEYVEFGNEMQVRVLVIDDDEDILFLANRYLSSGESDILIVPVSNSQDALQEVETGNIDAIICDFHLGPEEMNGLELLEWIRGQRLDIPFIIFTGRSREEIAIQALNLGADYYLEKGDDFEGLFTEIAHHIKNTVRSRKTEEALIESEQKYRTLVQSISDLIFVLDANDCFSQYHSPFKSDLLMQPDDFMHRHVAEALPAEIANQYLEHSKSVRTTGVRRKFEYSMKIDEQEKWYEASLDLHEDSESIVVTVTNISERKRSDDALRESEARKDSILRVAPVGIGVVVNRVFQFVSQTLLDITGYTNEDLIGKNTRMLYPSQEEFDKVGSEKYRDIRESGTGSIETKFVRKDGIIIDVDLRSTPVVKGDLEGAVTFTGHDITDRKRIERELIEADKRWVNTFDAIPDFVSVHDTNNVILKANKELLEFLGMEEKDVLGKKCYEVIHQTTEPPAGCPHSRTIASIQPVTDTVIDPRLGCPLDVTTSPIHDENGELIGIVHVAMDMTEQLMKAAALKESEEKYRRLVGESLQGMAILQEGRYVYVNSAFAKILGYTVDEILTLSLNEVIGTVYKADLERLNQNRILMEKGDSSTTHHRFRRVRKDGSLRWMDASERITQFDGKPALQVFEIDITEQVEAEEKIKHSESRFRGIFENAGLGIALIDLEKNITTTNSAFQKMFGYSEEELTSMTLEEISLPDSMKQDSENLERIISEGNNQYQIEKQYVRKNGELFWGFLTVTIIRDEKGNPIFTVGMVEDISEKLQVKEELQAEKDRAQMYLDMAGSLILFTDTDLKITMINKQGSKILGRDEEDILNKNWIEEFIPETHQKIIADYMKGLIDGSVAPRQTSAGPIIAADGSLRWIQWSDVPIATIGNRNRGILSAGIDITSQVKTKQDLERSEARFQAVFENAGIGMTVVDVNDNIIHCNPAFEKLVGYSSNELKQMKTADFTHPDDVKIDAEKFSEVLEGIRDSFQMEKRYYRKDGKIVWVNLVVTCVRYEEEDVTYVVGMTEDITERKKAESEREEEERKFKLLFERAPIAVARTDMDGRILSSNQALVKMLGYSSEELGQMTVPSFTHPDDWDIERALASELDEELRDLYSMEKRFVHKDGHTVWGRLSVAISRDEDKSKEFIIGMVEDITESKQKERTILDSSENLLSFFSTIDDLLFIIQMDGTIIETNQFGYRLLGYEHDELVGTHILSIHPPERKEEAARILQEIIEGKTNHLPIPLQAKDGTILDVETRLTLGRWSDQDVLFGVSREVSDIRQTLSELEESESRHRTIVESMNDMIFLFDGDNIYTEWYAPNERLLALPSDELVGKHVSDVLPADIADLYLKSAAQVRVSNNPITFDYSLTIKGEIYWFESTISLHADGSSIVAVVREVTRRKIAETEIEKQKEFFEKVVDSLPHPLYVINTEDYTIEHANKAATAYLKEGVNTCYEMTHDCKTPCSGIDHPCPLHEVIETGLPVVTEHLHVDKEGRKREIEVHCYPVIDPSGKIVQMIEYGIDVTEHKITLRALASSEEEFRQLYEDAPLAYQSLNIEGRIINVNSAWLDTLGYSRDEVIGEHFTKFLSLSSASFFEERFEQFQEKGVGVDIDYEMVRKDNSRIQVRFNGKVKEDENGEFKQSHCIFQDVTEWKLADILLRRQKEELGELAHIMSHDLGNKMKTIRSFIDILKKEYDTEVLERIDNIAQKTSDLLKSSADLADAGLVIEDKVKVDINKIASEIAANIIPQEVRFTQDEFPPVMGSAQHIGQIFQNLFTNALEHANATHIELKREDSLWGTSILVINDGTTISDDVREKIFLRGFSTKTGGRGLGLYIVRKLVEVHGWKISLDDTPKTTFRIIVN